MIKLLGYLNFKSKGCKSNSDQFEAGFFIFFLYGIKCCCSTYMCQIKHASVYGTKNIEAIPFLFQ